MVLKIINTILLQYIGCFLSTATHDGEEVKYACNFFHFFT